MIASVSAATFWEALGTLTGILAIIVIPSALAFHRKVVRPLRWVLGLKVEDSPTGEAILPIPQQIAQIRMNQNGVMKDVASIKAELHPNGGSSLRDSVNRNEKMTRSIEAKVIDLQNTVDGHVHDERIHVSPES